MFGWFYWGKYNENFSKNNILGQKKCNFLQRNLKKGQIECVFHGIIVLFSMPLGQSAQQFDRYAPDVVACLQLHALGGAVRLQDAGTDRGHLDAWIFLHEVAGFQHKVHRHRGGAEAEQVVERVAGQLQEGALHVFLPGWGVHHRLHLGAAELQYLAYLRCQQLHVLHAEGAGVGADEEVRL